MTGGLLGLGRRYLLPYHLEGIKIEVRECRGIRRLLDIELDAVCSGNPGQHARLVPPRDRHIHFAFRGRGGAELKFAVKLCPAVRPGGPGSEGHGNGGIGIFRRPAVAPDHGDQLDRGIGSGGDITGESIRGIIRHVPAPDTVLSAVPKGGAAGDFQARGARLAVVGDPGQHGGAVGSLVPFAGGVIRRKVLRLKAAVMDQVARDLLRVLPARVTGGGSIDKPEGVEPQIREGGGVRWLLDIKLQGVQARHIFDEGHLVSIENPHIQTVGILRVCRGDHFQTAGQECPALWPGGTGGQHQTFLGGPGGIGVAKDVQNQLHPGVGGSRDIAGKDIGGAGTDFTAGNPVLGPVPKGGAARNPQAVRSRLAVIVRLMEYRRTAGGGIPFPKLVIGCEIVRLKAAVADPVARGMFRVLPLRMWSTACLEQKAVQIEVGAKGVLVIGLLYIDLYAVHAGDPGEHLGLARPGYGDVHLALCGAFSGRDTKRPRQHFPGVRGNGGRIQRQGSGGIFVPGRSSIGDDVDVQFCRRLGGSRDGPLQIIRRLIGKVSKPDAIFTAAPEDGAVGHLHGAAAGKRDGSLPGQGAVVRVPFPIPHAGGKVPDIEFRVVQPVAGDGVRRLARLGDDRFCPRRSGPRLQQQGQAYRTGNEAGQRAACTPPEGLSTVHKAPPLFIGTPARRPAVAASPQ